MALLCLRAATTTAATAARRAGAAGARGYQNSVTSEFLRQVERDCDRTCPVPRFPPQKVTILGAGSDVGQVAALLLKQQPVVKVLALWDEEPAAGVLGAALDLGHLDTSTEVQGFQGRSYMSPALNDADLVLICGGAHVLPSCCGCGGCCGCGCSGCGAPGPDAELFYANMARVRSGCLAAAQFAPHALLAVQTPPVDCNFGLCQALLQQTRAYDRRRLLGLDAASGMRASQMMGALTGGDAAVPVVGGTSRWTRVPVFSANATKLPQVSREAIPTPPAGPPQTQTECLRRLVREADEIIGRVKCGAGQAHLSIGFATARHVLSLMTGLFVRPTVVEGLLVEQESPELAYGLQVCATPVLVGAGGVQQCRPPRLDDDEQQLLDHARCPLECAVALGRSSGEALPAYCRCSCCRCLPAD